MSELQMFGSSLSKVMRPAHWLGLGLRVSAIITAVMGLASCSSNVAMPLDRADATQLSLLPEGTALGTTLYGSADLGSLGERERELLNVAAARGMNGFTYYVDWSDLEPERDRYTLDEFVETLDELQALGVRPFVNLTVGDGPGYNLPDDLSDGAGGLADGVALNDAETIERFGRLLDRVVPLLVERGGFFLGVGNEVDVRFEEESPDELEAYVQFVASARQRVRAIEPRLAVGVTLTGGAVREQTPTFQALEPVTDVIPFNYGPIPPSFLVRPLEDIRADFLDVIAGVGSKPILIQELTCPSPESMGASLAWQRECYQRLFDEIAVTPQVRFASVFTFQDFGGDICEAVQSALFGDELEALPEEAAQRLADYTCELGLLDPGGEPKPAWDVFLDAVEANAN